MKVTDCSINPNSNKLDEISGISIDLIKMGNVSDNVVHYLKNKAWDRKIFCVRMNISLILFPWILEKGILFPYDWFERKTY